MLKTLQNAFKIKEIREKLLYTFFMLVVIRLGSRSPIRSRHKVFAELFAETVQRCIWIFQYDYWRFVYEHVSIRFEHHAIYHIFHYHATFNNRDSKTGRDR